MPHKFCNSCQSEKPVEEFHRRGAASRQAHCKVCVSNARKAWYAARKNVYADNSRRQRLKSAALVRSLKEGKPCMDCGGVFHYAAMEFDHRDGSEKDLEVGFMAKQGFGRDRILAEIAKCDLVCANCHRVRTHKRATARRMKS